MIAFHEKTMQTLENQHSKNLMIVDNPFAQVELTYLRDKSTPFYEFKLHADKLCSLLITESVKGVALTEIQVTSPLEQTKGYVFTTDVVIVPVLRAGLAMLDAAREFFPRARIGFAGLARDEETAIANLYYWKMPKITHETTVIITDPMLATGGSAVNVLERLQEDEPNSIRLVSVISAPEGIKAVHDHFPDVHITTAAVDSHLNDKKYIIPGLGDFGDRYFGTE